MDEKTNVTDQILDLLLDALVERQRARAAAGDLTAANGVSPEAAEEVVAEAIDAAEWQSKMETAAAKQPGVEAVVVAESPPMVISESVDEAGDIAVGGVAVDELEEYEDSDEVLLPEPLPPVGLGRMLGRLAMILALLLVVVNIPLNRFGTSLARAMPDEASLIIRDGLVLKGSGEKIYVLENNQLRWISSLDAFEFFGYRWEQVREVDDRFLATFEEGRPIHVLLKCRSSPHIYALEDGRKRWIKDIPTFEAEGYVWEDVMDASCAHLDSLPDGVPIPADAGTPP